LLASTAKVGISCGLESGHPVGLYTHVFTNNPDSPRDVQAKVYQQYVSGV